MSFTLVHFKGTIEQRYSSGFIDYIVKSELLANKTSHSSIQIILDPQLKKLLDQNEYIKYSENGIIDLTFTYHDGMISGMHNDCGVQAMCVFYHEIFMMLEKEYTIKINKLVY